MGALSEPADEDDTPATHKVLIPVQVISSDLPQLEKLKIAKSPAYQSLWPKTCDGHNSKGDKLQLDTTGFACRKGGSSSLVGIVAEIFSPRWRSSKFDNLTKIQTDHISCAHGCRQYPKECGQKPISLSEAAKEAASKVTQLKTNSGKIGSVKESPTPPTEPGVLSVSEIRMDGDVLSFQPAKADLTAAGSEFLDELTEPLSVTVHEAFRTGI
jgi:hypothetical protein